MSTPHKFVFDWKDDLPIFFFSQSQPIHHFVSPHLLNAWHNSTPQAGALRRAVDPWRLRKYKHFERWATAKGIAVSRVSRCESGDTKRGF